MNNVALLQSNALVRRVDELGSLIVTTFTSVMGTIARYLLPIDSKVSALEYADKAMEVLLQMEVISESPERNRDLIYNGNRSTDPFQMEPGDADCGFDVGGVYGGPGFIIVPEEYVDGAFCPQCNADITEHWVPQLRDEDGLPTKHDSKDVRISCPKCAAVFRIDEVKSTADEAGPCDKFYLTDRFVHFWDCRPFKPEWVAEFDRRLGCHHEVFEYGWT